MKKEDEILLSIDPNYRRCNICQRFYHKSILAFSRQPRLLCFICQYRKDAFHHNEMLIKSQYAVPHHDDIEKLFRTANLFLWFNSYRDSSCQTN